MLRRIIRRAIRYGRRLGLEEPFLTEVASVAIQRFQDAYPELAQNRDFIIRVISLEEERFVQTFERGFAILTGMIEYRLRHRDAIPEVIEFASRHRPGPDNASSVLSAHGVQEAFDPDALPLEQVGQGMAAETISALSTVAFEILDEAGKDPVPALDLMRDWGDSISSQESFLLYDTYGFPPELTAEIAREHGLEVDMGGFERGDGGATPTVPRCAVLHRQHGDANGLRESGCGSERIHWLRRPHPAGIDDCCSLGGWCIGGPRHPKDNRWRWSWLAHPSTQRVAVSWAIKAESVVPMALLSSRIVTALWPD